MRSQKQKKLVLISFILLAAVVGQNLTPQSDNTARAVNLKGILDIVGGYNIGITFTVEEDIVNFLQLDDFISLQYEKNNENVNLFIGYYNTQEKVSAAHSPLVCFPGQGWEVNDVSTFSLKVGRKTVNYSEMVASREDRKELVFYWYQAFDKTSPYVYINKINVMTNTLLSNIGEHAFVRISIPIIKSDIDAAREQGLGFIHAFYPKFLSYIYSE